MSAPAIPSETARLPVKGHAGEVSNPLWEVIAAVMGFAASLKLTVALFALGIFVIFVGTLAQTEADIWQIVRDYFHAWVMWVDVNLFFPKSFFPGMPHLSLPQIPAPGGMTVGVLMMVNLLAAHGWRFKLQASGTRLTAGLGIIAAGLVIMALVIVAGHNDQGFQGRPPFTWGQFWGVCLFFFATAWVAAVVGLGYWSLQNSAGASTTRHVIQAVLATFLIFLGGLLAWGWTFRPQDEALRIVWQLAQGGLAGLILLAGCILAFNKRAGIVLLHAGIGLLMINELLVARQAVEWQIFLQEGQTTNYARDIRTIELAIIDPSAKETDEHVVIPRQLLENNVAANARLEKAGKPLVNIADSKKLLPFDVAVLTYYKNADVRDLKSGEKSVSTAGRGLREALVELPAAKGTDSNSGVDFAAAYVKITGKDGSDLGTHLLSQLASEQKQPERFAEKIKLGGKEYQLFLRFKRDYKPYSITLVDVRKDDYVASNTPRNYSSDIRLVDASLAVDEPQHIKMNDPLRYRGETFYQSGYNLTPDGEATTLAVVRNRVWMIPYIACMVVATGLLAHFLITVTRFIGRRDQEERLAGEVVEAQVDESVRSAPSRGRKPRKPDYQPELADSTAVPWAAIGLPLLALGIFAMIVASYARPQKAPSDGFDYVGFGKLPVAQDGRVKPIDTLARNALRALSLRESIKLKGIRTAGAIIPVGKSAWIFKMSGEPAIVDAEHKNLQSFLESLKFDGQTDDVPRWILPEGWQQEANSAQALPTITVGKKPDTLKLHISMASISGDETRFLLDEVNRSRRELQLTPIETDVFPDRDKVDRETLDKALRLQLERATTQLKLGQYLATTVDLRGKPIITASQWLLDIVTGSDAALEYPVMRIDHPELLKLFDLKPRSGYLYTVAEIRPHIESFERQAVAAHKLRAEDLTLDQRKLLELDERLKLYLTLVKSFSPPDLPPLPTEQEFNNDPEGAKRKIDEFRLAIFRTGEEVKQMNAPRAVPLATDTAATAEEHWQAYPTAWTMAFINTRIEGKEPPAATLAFNSLLDSYRQGDVGTFNSELARYHALLAKTSPPLWNGTRIGFESYFNHFSPFYVGMPLYVLAFVLAIFGWLFRYRPLQWGAFTLIALTFLMHSGALVARIYISGRPPVTNLYSSAVFIGWALVLMGMIVEAIYRNGLGNIASAVTGFATLLVAYFLSAGGDTIGVLQAVLDTQFWLATHVVCITLGYAATYAAGTFGFFYIAFGMATPFLNSPMRKDLGRMIYGITCFALLFSFVGTVLGGLWADDSWGRFWGWDPKENGALIIVMWNALVLHARWDKMIGDRGLAVLSLGGNIVTSWSWFGVNELGIGLHSYGFTEGVLLALGVFVLSQIALILAGCLPTRIWASYAAEGK